MNSKSILTSICLLGVLALQASAQTVVKDSLDFAKMAAKSPLSLLDGQVSGLNIAQTDGSANGAINAYIRGLNAFRSDSQPLIILDGVILSDASNRNLDAFFQLETVNYTSPLNTLAFLNPYDIESIEVIKDLSATAVYGSKGANGVIVITTKLPTKGERNIDWRSNVSVNLPSRNSEAYGPSISHNHTASVNGTVNKTSYNISGFFRSEKGTVKGTGSNYGGLTMNFDTKANSVIWFNLNTFLGIGHQNNMLGTNYVGSPSMLLADAMPSIYPNDKVDGWLEDYDDNTQDYRSVTSAMLTVNFTPALVLRARLGVDFESMNRKIWFGNGTSFGLDNNGAASIIGNSLFSYNGMVDLRYSRFISDKHHIDASIEVNADGNAHKFNTMSGLGFFTHDLRANGLNLMESRKYLHKFMPKYTELGANVRLGYDFGKFAGVSGTLALASTPKYDDKPVFYPAANAYVDISEIFFKDSKAVSSLKITGGWGIAGKEAYVPYELFGNYLTSYYPELTDGTEAFHEGLNRLRSKEYNIGVQAGFINDRIQLAVKYYDKSTEDSFNMYCFGLYNTQYEAWAWGDRKDVFHRTLSLMNRGFELDLNADIINNGRVHWTAFLNGSYNVNQATDVSLKDMYGKSLGSGLVANANVLGEAVSSLYGYRLNADGSISDKTRDGQITEADKEVLGNTLPKLQGALGTTLSFHGFTLDILAKGALGFNVANLNSMLADGSYVLTEKYVEKGDYLRLSRVSLSYDIPMKVKWIQDFKVVLSGLNLATLTKYSGWNPDVNCFGASALSSGIDLGSSPLARTVTLGVNVKF